MGDLVRVRTFSPNLWSLIFSPTYSGVRFFAALYTMSDMFLSAGYFSPQVFPCTNFPLEICLQDIFSEITYNPLKRQMVGPKIRQTFALYSFFVRIVKDWNSLPNQCSMMKLTLTNLKKA